MSRRLIGRISVDAGLCMIGDPCYQIDTGRDHDGWMAFLNRHNLVNNDVRANYWRVCHPNDALGDWAGAAAVVVSTGYGDGTYPVYIEEEDGRVKSVTIEFFGREEDED